jgi:hypothetical protein
MRFLSLNSLTLYLSVLLLISINDVHSQNITLEEDFESENFTTPNVWTGDLDDFIFSRVNNQTQLQLSSDPDPSRSQLRTKSSTTYGSWEFYFRQEFISSNLNRAFIFLMADREDLNYLDGSPINGYAIRTGENGDPKRIRLIRFDNGIQHEILATSSELQPNQGYRVKVTRNRNGEWQLYTAQEHNYPPVPDSEIVIDLTHTESQYFGFLFRYTSANTDGFFIDHIQITESPEPFSLTNIHAPDPFTLQIDLNRNPDPVSLQNTRFTIGDRISNTGLDLIDESRLKVQFSEPVTIGQTHLVVTGLTDLSGEPLQNQKTEVLLTISPAPGDLVINEIMYDPLPPSEFQSTGQSEYIELFNRRNYAVSVNGLRISDNPDNPLLANTIRITQEIPVWISPNGYLLLYPESEELNFQQSRIGQFFDLPYPEDFHVIRLQRSALGLTLSGRPVALTDDEDNIIDQVYYHPGLHNPNLIDTRGISLERVNPDLPSSDSDNWSSSTDPLGGTPGRKNSLFQAPTDLPLESGITLEPNPFSPDGDDNKRNLFINYKLDEPDYLLRVRIFDRYGRLIRNLTESHPAGFKGTLTWDGRTNEGASNRIGIYIIFIEAYNSAIGKNRVFRESVVIARQF